MRRFRNRTTELSNLQFALLLTVPVLVFLVIVVVYPLGYSLWTSLHNVSFFGGFHQTFVGFDNYIEAFHSAHFWHSVAVSCRFTVESVLLTLLLGLGIALVLARPFRGKGLIRSIVILPWAVSRYGVGIMFKYIWRGRTGLFTALAYLFGVPTTISGLEENVVIETLAIGNAWNLAPLVAFFLLANIETIPRRLYDLASIDDCSVVEKFWYVTLPYLRYTLFIFAAISSVLSLKVFDYIFVQTGGGPGTASATLTYQIYKESFLNFHLGYGAALSVYLLLLILSSTLLLYVVWGRKES